VFNILGKDYLLETPKMGAVPRRIMNGCVASLSDDQASITGALDFLFQGY
jgi:toxin CcdB